MSPVGDGRALPPGDLAWVCDVVRAETAVVLDASKEYLVASRLLPLARRGGFPDVASYVSRMRGAGPAERWELVEAMTTNETSWFRDVEPFAVLRSTLLPTLAAARRASRSLRVWSAACSTGQEPYTIAMLVADAPELRGFRTEILATDIDRTALERARAATYSQMEVGRGLPADLVARHLERAGMQWRVREGIRSAVRFSELNLARPFPERGRFDVVFCRNVLIYFDTATKQQVLERLRQVLAPDGVLVLGAAETTLGVSDSWARVEGSRAALYRPLPDTASPTAAPAPGARAPRAPSPSLAAPVRTAPSWVSARSRAAGTPPAGAPTPRAAPPVLPRPATRPTAPPRVAVAPASSSSAPTAPTTTPTTVSTTAPTTPPITAPRPRTAPAPATGWPAPGAPRPPLAPPAGARPPAGPAPRPVTARPPAPRPEPTWPETRAPGRQPGSSRPDSGGSR